MTDPDCHPSFEKLKQYARSFGWRCLSDTWHGYQRHEFECAKGHRFERHASVVLYKGCSSCPVCEREVLRERWMTKITSRGGELVEGEFTTTNRRYRLRCASGHEWETTGNGISRGNWCSICVRKETGQRHRLAKLQAKAQAQGGRCLATRYTLSRDHYPFECSQGHRWKASGHMVLDGSWCPQCMRVARRLTIEEMQELVAKRGGRCLSTEYLGAEVRLTWECHRGHVWQALMGNVKYRGRWCRACAMLDKISAKNRWKRRRYEPEGKPDG